MKAPDHLGEDGARLWAAVTKGWELEEHDLARLRLACEQLDRASEARHRVLEDGLIVRDRFQQPKPHPAVDIERHATALAIRAIRELGLDAAAVDAARGPGLRVYG